MKINLEITHNFSKVFNGVTKNLAYLSTQYENLIRILGNDIPGERKILVGLTQIRGVGIMFANSIIAHLKIDPNSKIFNKKQYSIHSDKQLKRIIIERIWTS